MLILFIVILLVAALIFLIYASASISSNVYIKTICRKSTYNNEVILTFDDGVDPINTPKILNILKQNDIKAYFFIIGKNAVKYPKLVKQIADDGHIIGIHSYNHKPTFPILPTKKVVKELQETKTLLENITGQSIYLFRPPFGVTNPNIAKAVKILNLKTIGWNIRSFDTVKQSHTKTLNRIERQLSPGSIILLHDRLDDSDILLTQIIKIINKHNYHTSLL